MHCLAPSVPITLRQNQRIHHTVDGTQTFPRTCDTFSHGCVHADTTRQHIYGRRGQSERYRHARSRSRISRVVSRDGRGGISRDTDVTSRVTRCLDTFRNMRGKISFLAISFGCQDGRDTCSPSSRRMKKYCSRPSI